MLLIVADLLKIAPHANLDVVNKIVPFLNQYLPLYKINNRLRISHFLGQAAEETDGFRTLVEYASGRAYEGRRDLGNTQTGDGVRFKGRGMFDITGRYNYASAAKAFDIDLISHPELAATGKVAVLTACRYWNLHNLNVKADNDDIRGITRAINGGYNGLDVRELYTKRAKSIVPLSFLRKAPEDVPPIKADPPLESLPVPVPHTVPPIEPPNQAPIVPTTPAIDNSLSKADDMKNWLNEIVNDIQSEINFVVSKI